MKAHGRVDRERVREVLEEENKQPAAEWWLSFVEPGRGSLGIAIVRARGLVGATLWARRHGCNPGGEVMGWPLPEPQDEATRALPRNRLLTTQELEARGYKYGTTKAQLPCVMERKH